MKKKDRIYVAGHTGLVGSAICRGLKDLGYENILTVGCDKLDLTAQEPTERFFKSQRPSYVFLAAAKVGGIMANSTYKADFIYANSAIATNVIHAAYKYGVKKLLNLGSSCIYPKDAPQPLKESYLLTGPLEPTNEPYAVAKILAIKLCRYYNEQYGTNFISVMPTNLYGPNDNFDLATSHVLPALIRKFHLGKLLSEGKYDEIARDLKLSGDRSGSIQPKDIASYLARFGISKKNITLWGSGSVYREFLHVSDLADACIFLMKKYDARFLGEIVNIGSGADLRIKELAALVKKVVGYVGTIAWDRSKPDGVTRKLLDSGRIRKLGWSVKITLEDGIRAEYKSYLNKYCAV